jgi:septal ring factor EnvC (AmiA/AmiB activator)
VRRLGLLDVDARAPFGGDHVIAVASAQPLTGLIDSIRALDQKPEAATARRAVEQALAADASARVAVTAVFTAPSEMRCDPEVIRDATMLAACQK